MGADDQRTNQIHVTYFAQNPAAKIKNPQKLTLEFGINGEYTPNNTGSAPLVRQSDGAWQATLSRGARDFWLFLMLQVKDETTGQLDDNSGDYWDLLFCNPNGGHHFQGVEEQARSYAGLRFDNGISRPQDYEKALAVLEDFMKASRNEGYNLLWAYWDYKVRRDGNNDAAWRRISAEINQFLEDHRGEKYALVGAFNFVQLRDRRLPPEIYPHLLQYIEALDPGEAVKLDRMARYDRLQNERNPLKRQAALADFVAKYPKDPEAPSAAAERFQILRDLHDVATAEAMFSRLVSFDSNWSDTYATMAAIYIENDQKLDQALQLLDKADQLGNIDFNGQPTFRVVNLLSPDNAKTQGILAYWRARAYLQQGKGDMALPWAQKALDQRKSSANYFLAAQAYEATARKQEAIDAYIEALAMPSEQALQERELLEHLWIAGRFGSKEQLEQKIQARQDELFRKANYVPRLVDSPVTDYEFTTLKGEKFRSQDLRDKTVVLNFWATWCAPCLPELPGFQVLQQKHPELVVAAIAISSPRENLDKLMRDQRLDSLHIAATDALSDTFVPQGVPVTYVIDHGHIRVIHQESLSNVVAYVEADLAALKQQGVTNPVPTTAAR